MRPAAERTDIDGRVPYQMQLRRHVLDEKGERLVNRSGIYHVTIVKHKDEMVREGADVVERGSQDHLGRGGLWGLERLGHPGANGRRNRLQCGDKVRQKAGGVVIPIVEREPGGGPATAVYPRAGALPLTGLSRSGSLCRFRGVRHILPRNKTHAKL